MRSVLTAVAVAVFLTACGEPKTYKMDRMHAINPMGTFYVEGKVTGIDKALTQLTVGDVKYTNLTLQDDTGHYTFYFLGSAHSRQPVEGDNVKMVVKLRVLDQSFAGGGRAPIIEKFEYK